DLALIALAVASRRDGPGPRIVHYFRGNVNELAPLRQTLARAPPRNTVDKKLIPGRRPQQAVGVKIALKWNRAGIVVQRSHRAVRSAIAVPVHCVLSLVADVGPGAVSKSI